MFIMSSLLARLSEQIPDSGALLLAAHVNDRLWPDSADLGAAASRLLSGVHLSCCQRSRKGRPEPHKSTCGVSAINTFAATCPAPTLLLPGIIRRRCFCLVGESFLIFLVVPPNKDGQSEPCNRHPPPNGSTDPTSTSPTPPSPTSPH